MVLSICEPTCYKVIRYINFNDVIDAVGVPNRNK